MADAKLTAHEAANLIEQASAELCRAHYGMGPDDPWSYRPGDLSHNDDRLKAVVEESIGWRGHIFEILVIGGHRAELYDGLWEDAAIRAYVGEWLRDVWAARQAAAEMK